MKRRKYKGHTVGNEDMDADHKQLLDLLEAFYTLALDGADEFALMNNLQIIIELLLTHIKYEEDIMDRIGYARAATHKEDHEDIIKLFLSIEKDVKTANVNLIDDTVYLIRTLKSEHFIRHDRPFAAAIDKHRRRCAGNSQE